MNQGPSPSLRTHRRRGIWVMLATTAFLVGVSAVLVSADVDLSVANRFYRPELGWPWGQGWIWQILYKYGTLPGLGLTLAGVLGVAASLRSGRLRFWRRDFLLIVLTALVGGGVLVNGLFKPYWGRPRPRQVQQFGGEWRYQEFYRPGVPGRGQSFPCGHCTMGFLFVSMVFLRRKSALLAWAGALFGVSYGALLGAARILQGAHFVTDVLWSFGILLCVAAVLHYFILPLEAPAEASEKERLQRGWLIPALIVMGICLAFLTRRPFYETVVQPLTIEPGVHNLTIVVDDPMERRAVRFVDRPTGRVVVHAQGFGWSLSSLRITSAKHQRDDTLYVDIRVEQKGYFSEMVHAVDVELPLRLQGQFNVSLKARAEQGGP